MWITPAVIIKMKMSSINIYWVVMFSLDSLFTSCHHSHCAAISSDILYILYTPPSPTLSCVDDLWSSDHCNLVAACSNLCSRVRCRSRVSGWPWWQLLWVPAQGLADVRQDGRGSQEDVLRRPTGDAGAQVPVARAAATLAGINIFHRREKFWTWAECPLVSADSVACFCHPYAFWANSLWICLHKMHI